MHSRCCYSAMNFSHRLVEILEGAACQGRDHRKERDSRCAEMRWAMNRFPYCSRVAPLRQPLDACQRPIAGLIQENRIAVYSQREDIMQFSFERVPSAEPLQQRRWDGDSFVNLGSSSSTSSRSSSREELTRNMVPRYLSLRQSYHNHKKNGGHDRMVSS